MPWFKVDDKLHDHRKARAAGKAAMGVWVLAGSWAADNLTDGFVPATLLGRWGTRADAARLVTAGLWGEAEQDGERGWRFHEWSERQPTRAEKMAQRAARAAAGRKGGRASGASRREAKPQANGKQVASPALEPPSRPVPSIVSDGDDEPSDEPSDPPWSAQPVIASWLETCPERPPGRVVGQVSSEVKKMLDEGIGPELVTAGLQTWSAKRLHPSALASIVHEQQQRAGGPASGDTASWMRRRPQ